jgi:hypothetical protein
MSKCLGNRTQMARRLVAVILEGGGTVETAAAIPSIIYGLMEATVRNAQGITQKQIVR